MKNQVNILFMSFLLYNFLSVHAEEYTVSSTSSTSTTTSNSTASSSQSSEVIANVPVDTVFISTTVNNQNVDYNQSNMYQSPETDGATRLKRRRRQSIQDYIVCYDKEALVELYMAVWSEKEDLVRENDSLRENSIFNAMIKQSHENSLISVLIYTMRLHPIKMFLLVIPTILSAYVLVKSVYDCMKKLCARCNQGGKVKLSRSNTLSISRIRSNC